LGVLGPGLAGIVAVWLGARDIFLVDALSFVIAGILILMLPGTLMKKSMIEPNEKPVSTWSDVCKGARLLFSHPLLRFPLAIEFVSAIAGAQILVNTVLRLTHQHYG
jgi:MFS transporter, NRE family, putaive nickel resistance protein